MSVDAVGPSKRFPPQLPVPRSARTAGASRLSHSRYSTLPAGPGSELARRSRTPSPSSAAVAATPRIALARSPGARTTPPRPTNPRPTSNCGFTSTTRSPASRVQAANAGRTSRKLMNERSATTRSTVPPIASGVRLRALHRSRTRTRGSVRNRHASCPYPTSTATTCAAPARSRTSVKPPVDDPASRHRRPAISSGGSACAQAASAGASLCAPRDAYGGSSGPPAAVGVPVRGSWLPWAQTARRPAARTPRPASRLWLRPDRRS